MKILFNFGSAILIIGFIALVHADTVTLTPTDDMYSDPTHPVGHPVGELWVANYPPADNYQRIMMRFDLSQFTTETITSASLNLNRFFGCPSGDPTNTNIYEITQDWDENTWQENQHISHGTTVWANYIFSANGWHSIDITSLVQAWVDGGITNYGLVIEALANNKFTKCYSKEASSQSYHPYLEVNYEASGVAMQNTGAIPQCFLTAYPNPFNPTANLRFNLAEAGEVSLVVYDLMGREVDRIVDGWHTSGIHGAAFDGSDLASGVYIVRLMSSRHAETKKILLLK